MKKILFGALIASLATAGTAIARDGSGGAGGGAGDGNGREYVRAVSASTNYGTPGSSAPVETEIVSLSLTSVDPIDIGPAPTPPPPPPPTPPPPHNNDDCMACP